MEAEDAPAAAAARGRPADRAPAPRCPASPTVRGLGLLLAAELADGLDARGRRRGLLDAGLVVNAVTPTALRLAPSLLVTDDEIDEAVTAIGDVLADALATRSSP